MRLFDKDLDKELVVIAEIGVNHEGSIARGLELIYRAHEAGADAVKIQYGTVTDGPPREGSKYAWKEGHVRIAAAFAAHNGIHLFSSALDLEALKLCDELFPVIKIASRDNDIYGDILNAVDARKKPLIISMGGLDLKQRVELRNTFGVRGYKCVFLHCVSKYPTPIEEAAVENVLLGGGYSNHVIGPEACYAAVALGANPIEVHFTDDKTREFRDHRLSFDPEDLRSFIYTANKIRASL